MKKTALLAFVIFVLYSCTNKQQENKQTELKETLTQPKVKPTDSDDLSLSDTIAATARQALIFIKDKNYKELVNYFASEGVTFVPYGFIDTAKHKKLSREDFLEAINKKWVLTWGSYDGTGEPIKLTVNQYLAKFVYNADYLNAEADAFDTVINQGNSINNIQKIYPNHHFIDYHFSGFEQQSKGMDWTSLRMVFTKEDGQYFIVAIIHDQWTI